MIATQEPLVVGHKAHETPRYDYLLFAGPGRSATTYIYRALRANYAVSFPEIKEAHYYRDPRRYRRARRIAPSDRMLGDVANDAYMDEGLVCALRSMRMARQRVLVVVMLRDHIERAVSMLRFDRSRGRALKPGGMRALESRVVERRLTPQQLERIYCAGTDVAVLDFEALRDDPTEALNMLAALCGISPSPKLLPRTSENSSERSRNVLMTAAAVQLARALRATGQRSLLQRLKDSRRVHGLFFTPLRENGGLSHNTIITPHSRDVLHRSNSDCWDLVRKRSSEELGGLFLLRAGPGCRAATGEFAT